MRPDPKKIKKDENKILGPAVTLMTGKQTGSKPNRMTEPPL